MSDIDAKYLREKGIPGLLESIAADLVTNKPADPEQHLRSRFALVDGAAITGGEEVKIHSFTLDPACALVLVAASYARVQVDYSEVDLDLNKHLTPEFSKVNPFQKVPVLEHQGIALCDSGAIVRYLCHGKPALPLNGRDRAKIDSAFEAIRANILPEAATAAFERVINPRRNHRPVDQVAVAAAVDRCKALLKCVGDQYFKESHWVVGKELTTADMALSAVAFTLHQTVGTQAFADVGGPIGQWWHSMQQEKCYQDGLRGFAAAALQVHTK